MKPQEEAEAGAVFSAGAGHSDPEAAVSEQGADLHRNIRERGADEDVDLQRARSARPETRNRDQQGGLFEPHQNAAG